MLHIRGEFAVNTQVNGPKIKRFTGIFVTMLSMMVVFSSFAISAYADRTEDMKYTEAAETPSFGAEGWVPPQGEARIVAVKTPSFATEDWTGTMESSEALGAGTIPEPAPEKLNLDDYNPD